MDLRENIKKATLLDWEPTDNTKFFRLSGLSQAAQDRKMNDRQVKPPRNIHLVEDDDNNTDECISNFMTNEIKSSFETKHSISAAVKEITGGLDMSNKYFEEFHSNHLKDMKKKLIINSTSINNYKFSKNAAIMGLVKTNKILLEDLISNEKNNAKNSKKENVLKESSANNIMDANKYEVESIPHSEDPDVYIHPLLGKDKTKYKNIDLTIPRTGKRTKMTPKAFFLTQTDDSFFNFVKKKK